MQLRLNLPWLGREVMTSMHCNDIHSIRYAIENYILERVWMSVVAKGLLPGQ